MPHRELLAAIESGQAPERWEAAKQLVQLADRGDARGLVALLRRGKGSGEREAAAWVLGLSPAGGREVVAALLASLADTRESPIVRAQAAEALGVGLERRAGAGAARLRERAGRALLSALEHPDPELRFWAAFSLGKLRYRPALAALRSLAAADLRYCPGWWRVCDEARTAAKAIERSR